MPTNIQLMRLNITIDDDAAAAVSERAEVEGVTRVEWIRRAVSAALCSGLYRIGTPDVSADVLPCVEVVSVPCPDVPDRAEEIAALKEKIRTLEAVTHERDHAIEVLARLTAENDRMAADLTAVTVDRDRMIIEAHEVELLRAEIVLKDQVIGERADEIRWLRGEVSKLNDKLTPVALPEKAGTGRRPWWRFWE